MSDRPNFHERRTLMLVALDKLQSWCEGVTFDDFAANEQLMDSMIPKLQAVGGFLYPGNPHASQATSELFHDARNKLAHREYFEVTAAELWALLERVPLLREEVAENDREPPPRSASTERGRGR